MDLPSWVFSYADHIPGTERDSSDLIPGDIVNLTSLPLSLVPADFFILSGDAIINESMLTGESVPVSKVPAKDEDLVRWKELKDENPKSFLYAGTRAVRIRGSFAEDNVRGKPALAVVARTGRTCRSLVTSGH